MSGRPARSRVWTFLTKRRGSPQWDIFLRTTGVLALLAIYPTTVWNETAEIVAFVIVTLFLNGPLAPLFPATYEPVLMLMGRMHPPLVVAATGVAGTIYIEFVNYHLYRTALMHPKLERVRGKRWVQRVVEIFNRRPFFAVWLCSWSPLPYWIVRFLAPIAGYPVRPYLIATFLGRFPRLWFFAALGALLPIPTAWLATTTLLMLAVGIAAGVRQRRTIPEVHPNRGSSPAI